MSVVDIMRLPAAKLRDSNDDLIPMDFYYGSLADWITVDLANQANDFIWLNPIVGDVPEKLTGFLREDYRTVILIGRLANKDLSKEQQEAIIWTMRPIGLQYIRRLFEEVNSTGAKLFMPFESATIEEVRDFTANSIYGVQIELTIKERFPSETC